MIDFERMLKQGELIEKYVRWFVIFVVVGIVFAWIGQEFLAVYLMKNPHILNSWFGEMIEEFNKGS